MLPRTTQKNLCQQHLPVQASSLVNTPFITVSQVEPGSFCSLSTSPVGSKAVATGHSGRAMPTFAALVKSQHIVMEPECQGPSTVLAAGNTDQEASSLLQELESSGSLGPAPVVAHLQQEANATGNKCCLGRGPINLRRWGCREGWKRNS